MTSHDQATRSHERSHDRATRSHERSHMTGSCTLYNFSFTVLAAQGLNLAKFTGTHLSFKHIVAHTHVYSYKISPSPFTPHTHTHTHTHTQNAGSMSLLPLATQGRRPKYTKKTSTHLNGQERSLSCESIPPHSWKLGGQDLGSLCI